MGYYDGHYTDPEQPRRSGSRKGYFWAGLLGAIIGIIVFLVLSPFLASQGWLPSYDNNNGDGTTQVTGPSTTKKVNVDVTTATTQAVDKVSPAVVAVINLQSTDIFSNQETEAGIGSGIVYKKSGNYAYVVTNNHVVEGANKLEVRFDDETKVPAELLGTDSLYDLAVLRIPSKDVKTVASFGNSSGLKRGEPVIAIGNPLGFSGTVTEGIVSSINRTIERTVQTSGGGQVNYNAQVIQTDAAINPGNSGGALVNLEGQVVGINSLKIAETNVEGIGFAIPINVAVPVINQLESNGKIQRPYLGVSIVGLDELPATSVQQLHIPSNVKGGIVVTQVSPGSPAQRAGLKEGDLIVQIGNFKIDNYVDFSTYLYTELKVGQKVKVKIYRNGKLESVDMTLGGKVFS